MMVNRRHPKNALAAQFERTDLQNYRHRFNNENSADKEEKNLLLDDHGDDPKRSSKRKRAHSAHKNLGGMRVVPKKTQRSANQGSAQDGQLTDSRDVLDFEISRPSIVAADVGQHRQRTRCYNRAPDGQTIESVRKIHRIRRACYHNGNENQKRHERQRPEVRRTQQRMNDQVRMHALQERNHQLCGIRTARGKNEQTNAHQRAHKNLQQQFVLAAESEIPLLRHFRVIVDESDSRKRQQREQREQHKTVSEVRPQQSGHHGRQHDQHPAHRRRARFLLMILRPLFANVLPNLQLAQFANQPGPKHQSQKHRGQASVDSANGDVAKYVKRTEIFLQDMVQKVVEHLMPHLLRVLQLRRVNREQSLDDALHLHAARAFHKQQISGRDKINKKFRSPFGRGENSSLRTRNARGDRSFHDLRSIALHADDPIDFPGLRRSISDLAVQFRRGRAKFAHFSCRKNPSAIVGSRRENFYHRVQRRRARAVAVVDQRRSVGKTQQFTAHRRRLQGTKHRLRFGRANSPDTRRRKRPKRVRNNVTPRQGQLQPSAPPVFQQNKRRTQRAAILDRFSAEISGVVDAVSQDAPRCMRSKSRHQRIIRVQHRNRIASIQSFNQLALSQRNLLNPSKKFQMRRRNPRHHANIRLGNRRKLLQLIPPRHSHLQHRRIVAFFKPKHRERQPVRIVQMPLGLQDP